MKYANAYAGILNNTLRGIKLESGTTPDAEMARLIAKGIYRGITSVRDSEDFAKYCKENYGGIDIK
jgi:hypothetical protein